MKRPDARIFLADALQAVRHAREFMGELTAEEYAASREKRASVSLMIQVIGESLRRAVTADPPLRARITSVDQIIGTRNRVAHGYPQLEPKTIWAIVREDLPILERELETLLTEHP